MQRIGVLAIAVAMTVAACGGSDETAPEPDVEVEAADEVVREAGGDVKVVDGCRIEPTTLCPGANLRGANLEGVDLSRANLTGANLSEVELLNAGLLQANLRDANLSGARLYGTYLSGADLSGADLRGANLRGAELDWVLYCDTTMPDGTVRNDNC